MTCDACDASDVLDRCVVEYHLSAFQTFSARSVPWTDETIRKQQPILKEEDSTNLVAKYSTETYLFRPAREIFEVEGHD